MTLTHWFLLFGGLTILAIAIDGIRRMVSKPTTLAIDLDETLQNLVQEDYGAELPNGGARVVGADMVAPVVATAAVTVAAEEAVEEMIVEQVQEPVVAELEVEEVVEEVVAEVEETTVVAAVEEELEVESLSIEAELEIEPELSLDEELAEEILLEDEEIEAIDAEAEVEEQPVELIEEEVIEAEQAPEFDLAAPEEVVAKEEEQAEANPLVAAFDPTRPVHEVVESHKMVQSDMFADMEAPVEAEPEMVEDWQEYAAIEEAAAEEEIVEDLAESLVEETAELEEVAEIEAIEGHEHEVEAELEVAAEIEDTVELEAEAEVELAADEIDEFDAEWQAASAKADDILLTDTGLEDDEPQGQSPFAKVTSFFAGRKMLEMRRKQEEDAQALEELTQAEDSVVANVEQVLTIIVAAKDAQGFYGHNLKTLAEACGMVHGSMGLFHRHEDGLTEGSTQFSMANMTETGAFDMDTIENIHTAGVVFFMTLPSANDSMRAFDYMVETAQCLANNLGGELYDDSRSVLRAQTVEHYRQRIREFERQRLARRAHGGI